MEENKVIRVAQILGRTNNGGVENLILNYYYAIDKSKIQYDFFVESLSDIIDVKKIRSLGGNVYIIPSIKKLFKYKRVLMKLLSENRYDIVQSNINSLSIFPLKVAKKANIKVRIANSLSTSNLKEKIRDFIKNILRKKSKKYATHYFACSNLAGVWLFGKDILQSNKFYKVNNAVITQRYAFNPEFKSALIKKHSLEDRFVVGNIGRLEKQKNQLFLIDVFFELLKFKPNAFLIIIGDGELEVELHEKLHQLGLDEKCLILTSKDVGVRGEVAKYYSLFDCFVLPSLYEGLPTVGVEAQIASLPCFFASTITEEVKISDKSFFIDLNEHPNSWAKIIFERTNSNIRESNVFIESYDIKVQSKNLTDIYFKLLEEIQWRLFY